MLDRERDVNRKKRGGDLERIERKDTDVCRRTVNKDGTRVER